MRAIAGVVLAACLHGCSGSAAAQGVGETSRGLSAEACQQSLGDLYRRVSPAVVLINASSINPYDIEHRIRRVSGSGAIVDPAGLVVTNAHVVFGRQIITVTLDNGDVLPAQLIGADPIFDIALLRVPVSKSGDLPALHLADSDGVEVGLEVYALGNPLGLNQTLTRGIVSAVNRVLPGPSYSLTEPLIQTDAAINPGNSGGPLVNRCGDVVGMTTAVIPDAQNLGFAVPSNLIATVLPALLQDGRIIRTWFGVQGQFVVPDLKALLRIPLVDGFLVESVEPGSPAAKAGLEGGEFELTVGGQPVILGGDILTEINGQAVDAPPALAAILRDVKIGDTLQVAVFRDGKAVRATVVVAERPVLPSDLAGASLDAWRPADHSDGAARPIRTPRAVATF